ncbi:acetyltransferase [Amycolatopsis jejuensis]|uniref:acetyltransferase n=1 Tax=Amycolatopsis jejuensis TaxID=330084 RepID=UPI000A43FB65|nr:acetyltransferase [Amycolatopsis jejuensis]
MIELRRDHGSGEYARLLEIWRSAVEATHHFLAPSDVEYYATRVPEYLPEVALTVATVDGVAAGFSGTAEGKLEMLFVHDDFRGQGVGSALLRAAVDRFPELTLDVNEQNPSAVGFYLHQGFVVTGRQPLDSDGRPFPLLQLKRA